LGHTEVGTAQGYVSFLNPQERIFLFAWPQLGTDGEGPAQRPNLPTGYACGGPSKKKKKPFEKTHLQGAAVVVDVGAVQSSPM
jgi:hypothetical protein